MNTKKDKMLEKSQQQLLRVAMLKQRYAHIIVKSQQQVLGDAYDEEEMKKKAALWDKQLQEQKDNSKRKRDEDRKAARIAIESIKRTVSFGDDLQAERDFLTIIGCRSRWYELLLCVPNNLLEVITHTTLSQPQVYVMV
ncbi:hypothetical protein H5410_011589 [Solanum commersonii]|uniref:Uncharacterized protein n=1 Tax=Solanum commersonii TaxID=4109 RepID=A0A9J6AQ34_SOLCO|nr:hypothetical protein H5410_011589 [Solanum commersonii]